jgi:hypothetical protein
MATFTTIAAGVGLASTVGTTVASFSQASKQRDAQEKAQLAAEESMREARKRLEVNYADALSIQKEPYERQREALLSAGAQAMQQGVESDRGGAATAGRVLAAQTEAQGKIRDQMNQDLFDLEAMKAEESSRLRDINAQLDLQEVAGAQQAAAAAEEKALFAEAQGIQGIHNSLMGGLGMYKMFGKGGTHSNQLLIPEESNTDPVKPGQGGSSNMTSKATLQNTSGMPPSLQMNPVGPSNMVQATPQSTSGMPPSLQMKPIVQGPNITPEQKSRDYARALYQMGLGFDPFKLQ